MSSFMQKANKWNDQNIADKIGNIRLAAKIMPSSNTAKSTLYMDWVSVTTKTEARDSASS